jgi:hypothetical protein
MKHKSNKESPPRILYHYTTQEGLRNIIAQKNIWATNIHYLNDATEFSYAINLTVGELAKMHEEFPGTHAEFSDRVQHILYSNDKLNVYVSSFTEDGDLLSQWRGYCSDSNGFSIGLNYGEILRLGQEQGFILSKCLYDEGEQRTKISHILDEAYKIFIAEMNEQQIPLPPDRAISSFIHNFVEAAPFLKDPNFSEEAEWRLISSGNISSFNLEFRAGKSMIIPYTEVKLTNNHNKLPIAEIIVGPTPHMDLSIISLRHFLESEKIRSNVKPSKVPYRAW